MWYAVLLGLLFSGGKPSRTTRRPFFSSANGALDCHSCAGAETLPQYAQDALAKANISSETDYWVSLEDYPERVDIGRLQLDHRGKLL